MHCKSLLNTLGRAVERMVGLRGLSRCASAYEISKSTGFHVDFGFQNGFLDFKVDFWIFKRISGFQSGFLNFKRISGFHLNRYYSAHTAKIYS